MPPPPRRNLAALLGILLTLLGAVGYFALVVPRWSPYWPTLRDSAWLNLALVFAGVACSLVAVARARGRRPTHRGRRLAPLLATLNVALAGLFVWYLVGLSGHLPAAAAAPALGSPAPDIALTDQHGAPLRLADLRGRNVLLVFYRGFW